MEPSRQDRMAMCRRDALMLRHDWARTYGQGGRDYITRALDTAIEAMEVELDMLDKGDHT